MYNPKLHFHFTGIGGSGMSGLAEILLTLGFKVSGSDAKYTEVCRRLEQLGAEVFRGHRAENLPEGASLLVYSSAINLENSEVQEARRRRIPVIRRAEVLAELMRLKYGVGVAGSHGKTTTTTMIAQVLERGGFDPTVIIGGQVKSLNTGSRVGKGEFLVAETDESDRSFLLLKPTIAVVTNIDAEHLNAYNSLQELEESFAKFVSAVPFYGLAVLCIDDKRVRDLAAEYSGRKVTYGFSLEADLQAVRIAQNRHYSSYDLIHCGELLGRVELPCLGRHLILNSLAAVAVGIELGIPTEKIIQSLGAFPGVKRRLEVIGEAEGVTVMNDYGHHPTEIMATLKAIREGWGGGLGKLRVIFQPHRYTRTKQCFVEFLEAFSQSDELILTEIYPASEEPIEGVSGRLLFEAVVHQQKEFIPELEDIPKHVAKRASSNDVVLCLGAGSVGNLPEAILEELKGGK